MKIVRKRQTIFSYFEILPEYWVPDYFYINLSYEQVPEK